MGHTIRHTIGHTKKTDKKLAAFLFYFHCEQNWKLKKKSKLVFTTKTFYNNNNQGTKLCIWFVYILIIHSLSLARSLSRSLSECENIYYIKYIYIFRNTVVKQRTADVSQSRLQAGCKLSKRVHPQTAAWLSCSSANCKTQIRLIHILYICIVIQ